jgi:heme/copper-type cytochrome/quinol oxidase subunit 2
MERKYLVLGGVISLLVLGAVVGRKFLAPEGCPEAEGKEAIINMRALENQWKWEPSPVNVSCGDMVILNIYNEDAYDHGFALDVYGINKRIPPKTTTTVTFRATTKGEFIFYCSVPCGEGHFDQKGKLIVGDAVVQ